MIDRSFIDELASKAPTPGGGGAAALGGALASALASMVGNLTVGKKTYAAVEEETIATLERLSAVRERLLVLIDKDAEAFRPLAAAYGLPKTTPEEKAAQNTALQEALIGACEVPLEIMRACAEVIELTEFMAAKGSRLAHSDAGVAAVFAKAALLGASYNVYINVGSMDDTERAQAFAEEANSLIATWGVRADVIADEVLATIKGSKE